MGTRIYFAVMCLANTPMESRVAKIEAGGVARSVEAIQPARWDQPTFSNPEPFVGE
jgi:hypothetical protein